MTNQDWHEHGQHEHGQLGRRNFLRLGGSLAVAAGATVASGTPGAAATESSSASAGGDQATGIVATFPPAAFMHNNPHAKIIDVTKVEEALGAPAGTNATPNDASDDDSAAFIYVLNWMAEQQSLFERDATNQVATSYMIYVPDGTYHVSRTIAYEEPPLLVIPSHRPGRTYWVHMRIVGQTRENTRIWLKNNSPGFDNPDEPKAVIDFSQEGLFNNISAQTVLRNITVKTGHGNPGAVGVDFYGANNAHIGNVAISSPDGVGPYGLHLPIGIASGYYHDLVIRGFDYGIEMQQYHFINPVLENVVLIGQRAAGIRVGDCMPVLRRVWSSNSVPALQITGAGAHVVMVDSVLRNGDTENAAIELADGHLFLRDVNVAGYGAALERNGQPEVVGDVDEYVSDEVISFDDTQPTTSMRLPVAEIPAVPWPDVSEWANVDDFGATGEEGMNDHDAIQAAMDSGAEVVYFPRQAYWLNGEPVRIPPSVRRVAGLFTSLISKHGNHPIFEIVLDAQQPVTIEDIHRVGGGREDHHVALLNHLAPRTVSMHTIRSGGRIATGSESVPSNAQLYQNNSTGPNGDLFLTNVNGLKMPGGTLSRQRVWARWINTEQKDLSNFGVAEGAVVWVLGYKVEGGTGNFEVLPGGVLEVLGGLCNQWGPSFGDEHDNDLAFRFTDGQVSMVLSSNGPNRVDEGEAFDRVIEDTEAAQTIVVTWDELPPRVGRPHNWVVPLYTHYDPATVAQATRR